MKIVKGWPPNFEAICAAFPWVRGNPRTIFTYGDTLYAPGGGKGIDGPLRIHEQTHARQQAAIGVEEWWRRYIEDPGFRLAQEVEAYHAQYRAMSKVDKLQQIRRIAGDLSGPMYGRLCSFEEAKEFIRSGRCVLALTQHMGHALNDQEWGCVRSDSQPA